MRYFFSSSSLFTSDCSFHFPNPVIVKLILFANGVRFKLSIDPIDFLITARNENFRSFIIFCCRRIKNAHANRILPAWQERSKEKKQKRKVCREHQIPKTAHLSNCIFLNNKHNQVLLKSVSQSLFLTLLLEAHWKCKYARKRLMPDLI